MKNVWRILRIALPLALILLIAGFVLWATTTNPIMAEAEEALLSTGTVQVGTSAWIAFEPADQTPVAGFIMYPGGRVDPRAYAPTLHALADAGYLAVIVPMPLNLAVMGANRADEVIAAYPGIDTWVIGGHSLGGSMAAAYAESHPDLIDGLALMAAYATEGSSLAGTDLPVLTLYGSQDGVLPPAELEPYRATVPADAQFVEIEGGNHAQFGYYGLQAGDGTATLSHAEQQAQVVEALLAFMAEVTTR